LFLLHKENKLFFQSAPHLVNEIPDLQKCHLESTELITLHKLLNCSKTTSQHLLMQAKKSNVI